MIPRQRSSQCRLLSLGERVESRGKRNGIERGGKGDEGAEPFSAEERGINYKYLHMSITLGNIKATGET